MSPAGAGQERERAIVGRARMLTTNRVLPDQVRKRMVMQKHAAAGRPEVQTRQLWYTMQYQALGWLGGTVPSNFR